MALWNSNGIFNRNGDEGGFVWNSDEYINVITISDRFRMTDDISDLLIKLIFSENVDISDEMDLSALFEQDDEFFMADEEPFVALLIQMAEELGIKDELTELLVNLYLEDNQEALDEIKTFAELLFAEEFEFNDIADVYAFFKQNESFELSDEVKTLISLFLHDQFGLIDRDPKEAISDFMIGHSDDVDTAYDYLLPLKMKIDFRESDFQIMPPVESATVEFPNVDGSLVESTVYKERLFKVACYSEDNLNIAEKEDLKRRITEVLDSTKHQTKKMTIQSRGITFDVKYDDNDSKDGPAFVKSVIQFRSQPYGYDMFEQELFGGGLILNQGVTPLRPKFVITGPVSNPTFALNGNVFRYNGSVPSGSTLTMDFEKYTCFLTNISGTKTNVLHKMSGEFISIEPGKSVVLVPDNNTSSRIVTTWRNSVLW